MITSLEGSARSEATKDIFSHPIGYRRHADYMASGQGMGKVRIDVVKRAARDLLGRYPDRFTADFEENKKAVSELMAFETKKLRNKVAGYVTSLKRAEARGAAKETEAPVEEAAQPAA